MRFLECDDMMEGKPEYCAADYKYCDENRMRCKKADDFYFTKDGQHYYQRFVVFKKKEYDHEQKKFIKSYVLRDFNHEFEDVPLQKPEDAYSLIHFLYRLCDTIDRLGGYSEYLKHDLNKGGDIHE